MAKMMLNEIKLDTGKYRFDFRLRSPIVVVNGDSGTGNALLEIRNKVFIVDNADCIK